MSHRDPIPSRKQKRHKNHLDNRKRIKKIILALPLLFLAFSLTLTAYFLGTAMASWKELDLEKLENIQQSSLVFDYQDEKITDIHTIENRIKIPFSDIPLHVRNAFIAVEDIRFYKHPGFDVKRLVASVIKNIQARAYVQGGGTITQQVIRNSHLSQKKVMSRKIQEIYLAYQLEKKYSKDQILESYLNLIYFAKGTYGIETASRRYFDKSAKDLTIAEGAMLAGVVKNPSVYSPLINKEKSISRRNLVLDLMAKNQFISPEEAEKSKVEPVSLLEVPPETYPHRFFMDMALNEAANILGVKEESLFTNGYRIYTTLDKELQDFAEDLFSQPDFFPQSPASSSLSQGVLIVLDSSSGEVRCILGGRDETGSDGKAIRKGFNRAIQSKLQPGSAIKPLVAYVPAIENFGYTPVTFIEDSPITIGNYTPSNYGGRFRGWVTLREAVAASINIPAVKTLYDIGLDQGLSFGKKLGLSLTSEDRNLSLALGGIHSGISPMELTRAYATLADQGKYKDYTTIRRIEDSFGVPLYEFRSEKQQRISQETSFIMNNILQSTIEWQGGTASRLKPLGFPIAAKTGTVQLPDTDEFKGISGAKDAWIVVYNPDYVVTVWMGFDHTNAQNYLPPGVVGGSFPAEMAKQIVQKLFSKHAPSPFVKPLNVIQVELDKKALEEGHEAVLASPLTPPQQIVSEYFIRNTVPRKETDYWVMPKVPTDFNTSLSYEGFPIISFNSTQSFAMYEIYRSSGDEEASIPVHRIGPGKEGKIQWVDTLTKPGQRYHYFVIPLHPEIIIDGKPLHGSATRISTTNTPESYLHSHSPLLSTPQDIEEPIPPTIELEIEDD